MDMITQSSVSSPRGLLSFVFGPRLISSLLELLRIVQVPVLFTLLLVAVMVPLDWNWKLYPAKSLVSSLPLSVNNVTFQLPEVTAYSCACGLVNKESSCLCLEQEVVRPMVELIIKNQSIFFITLFKVCQYQLAKGNQGREFIYSSNSTTSFSNLSCSTS